MLPDPFTLKFNWNIFIHNLSSLLQDHHTLDFSRFPDSVYHWLVIVFLIKIITNSIKWDAVIEVISLMVRVYADEKISSKVIGSSMDRIGNLLRTTIHIARMQLMTFCCFKILMNVAFLFPIGSDLESISCPLLSFRLTTYIFIQSTFEYFCFTLLKFVLKFLW